MILMKRDLYKSTNIRKNHVRVIRYVYVFEARVLLRNNHNLSECSAALLCVYVREYARVTQFVHVFILVCVYVRVYVRMYVCTYVCTYVCKFARVILCDSHVTFQRELRLIAVMSHTAYHINHIQNKINNRHDQLERSAAVACLCAVCMYARVIHSVYAFEANLYIYVYIYIYQSCTA